MGDERDRLAGYVSRVVSGLVAGALVAVSLHAEVAAASILVAVMLLVLAVMCLVLRRAL